jgi:hypothetical protein
MRTGVLSMEVTPSRDAQNRRSTMSCEGEPNALLKWFGDPSADEINDRRLDQWRANHDEARAIADYFRWMAGRRGAARREASDG